MNDLLVYRRTDRTRESAIAFERGDATALANGLFGDAIELERGHARLHRSPHHAKRSRRELSRFRHRIDITR